MKRSELWAEIGLVCVLLCLLPTCGLVAHGQSADSSIAGPATIPAGEAATYKATRETTTDYDWSIDPAAELTPQGATAMLKATKPGAYTLGVEGTTTERYGFFRWRTRTVTWGESLKITVTDPRPLGKWQVSYPASNQTVKAVSAEEAVAAGIPPAPVAKALSPALAANPPRGPPGQRMLGLKPTPPGKLQAALRIGEPIMAKLRALPQPPENYDGSGGVRDFGMYGNSTWGTCVTAEEAAAKSVISAKTGAPEIRIPDRNAVDWARKHGYLNGAYLDEVLKTMVRDGLIDDAGREHRDDDTAVAIDGTKKLVMQLAIYYTGMVKVAINAGPVMAADNGQYGWILLNARGGSLDHCVGYCGYGSLEFCCQTLGVKVPAGADPKRFCLIMFTWSRLGIVSWEAALNMTGEWWMRGTDPDRLDAEEWRMRYKTAMDDITGGVVIPPNAADWRVEYPSQGPATVDARDAADAIQQVPYKGKPTATKLGSDGARLKPLTKILRVPVSADVRPTGDCPTGNCGQDRQPIFGRRR